MDISIGLHLVHLSLPPGTRGWLNRRHSRMVYVLFTYEIKVKLDDGSAIFETYLLALRLEITGLRLCR